MIETFSISPRILSHLGEDLIKNESIAILELVKNSYDACAKNCTINFLTEGDVLTTIEIIDDGVGMSADVIKNVWLKVGTDFKFNNLKINSCGRMPLGEKGIGRLGVHKLGHKIILISKSDFEKEVVLNINWRDLKKAKEIEDFKIDVTEKEVSESFPNSTGTKIIISDLKSNWDKRKIREVYRNLASLNSPFSDTNEDFKVLTCSNNPSLFAGLPSFEDIKDSGLYFGHCAMEGNKITEFNYDFKPWSSLEKIDQGRSVKINEILEQDLLLTGIKIQENEKQKDVKVIYDIDLTEYRIGKIEFDIIIYEKDSQIFNFVNAEKTTINNYLRENGGIRVYRDGVRVYDYGERDNDWLGIDLQRVHRVGGNVSNNIVIGSVRIKRSESSGLTEKTNREGFIENETYSAFVDAVDYALSLFVRQRNIDKSYLTTLYKKHKVVEPVLSDLNDVIDIVEKKVLNKDDKDEILKYLYRINSQYKEVKEVLIKSANAGLNLSVVIHEIEKQVSALVGCAERNENKNILDISIRLEHIVRGYSAMIRKSSIRKGKLSDIVKIALDNYQFRFSDHLIEIYSNFKDCQLEAFMAEAESISVLTNLLDNSIFWLSYARKEKRKISVFITDQFEGFNSIIVSDNGPGFNIPTNVAIQPFITGKPHNIGMGLGLHIANEMMSAMKGQILFLDENEINFPDYISNNKISKAIVALCFPKEQTK